MDNIQDTPATISGVGVMTPPPAKPVEEKPVEEKEAPKEEPPK